jgi:hypothetical protein
MQVDLGMRGQEERVTRFVAGRDELLQSPGEDELLGSRLDFASGRFFDCLHLRRTIGARARKAIGPPAEIEVGGTCIAVLLTSLASRLEGLPPTTARGFGFYSTK